MKIIINADDFGHSEEVNRAIADAFSRGWVTNTTIMTNMPGYEDAVGLANARGFGDRVGLHLNFFEGQPLSEALRADAIVCDQGRMSPKRFHSFPTFFKFMLPYRTSVALAQECKAQMQRYQDAGFTLQHLDSHFHAHTFFSFYRVIRSVNRSFGFKTIRLSLNLFVRRSFLIKLYKNLFNRLLRMSFRTSRYFTSASEFVEVAKTMKRREGKIIWPAKYTNGVCEIMVHPAYDERGALINLRGVSFEELFQYLDDGMELVSYCEL